MKPNRFLVKIDTILDIENEKFEVIAGDYLTNILDFEITQNKIPYDLTGLGIAVDFYKPDRYVNNQDMNTGVSIIDEVNGKVTCVLEPNSMNVEGRVKGQLRIFRGVQLLTSRRFEFFVRNPLAIDKVVESDANFPILVKLMSRVDELQKEIILAEGNRDIAEQNREQRITAKLQEVETTFSEFLSTADSEFQTFLSGSNNTFNSKISEINGVIKQITDLIDSILITYDNKLTEVNETMAQVASSISAKIEEVNSLISTVEQAEQGRAQAELERVLTEKDRVAAEQARVEAENNRMNLINSKVSQEEFNQHKIDYTEQRQQDQLKVAKVEKELDDYQKVMSQVNVNQEAKQTVKGYGAVSLPPNAATGQVSASVKGRTITQLIEGKGNSLDGWKNLTSDLTLENGFFKYRASANGQRERYPINIRVGEKYYISYYYKTIGIPSSDLGFRTYMATTQVDTLPFLLKAENIDKSLTKVSHLITSSSDIDNISFRPFTTDVSHTGFWHFQSILVVNLTRTFGAGNEPTKEECDKLLTHYIAKGTKSTISAMRLKSVGKNLLNPKNIVQGNIYSSNGEETTSTTLSRTGFISVQPNTAYTTKHFNSNIGITYYFYDVNKKYISSTGDSSSSFRTNTTPSNCYYIRLVFNTSNPSSLEVQLEKNTVASSYEPYDYSTQYLNSNTELRSLPNGTKDEIRDGEHIKRVNKYVLQASDVTSMYTSHANLDWARIKKPVDSSIYNRTLSYSPLFETIIDGYTEIAGDTASMDKIDNIGKYNVSNNTADIFIGYTKGTTLAQARELLVGKALTYQLAEPEEKDIEVSGTLLSYPNGTVYVENVVADAGIYEDGISTQYTDLPIKEIDKLVKYDFVTGIQTTLDTSKAAIDVDKLSFTHPDIVNGDIIFFDYYYDREGTLGETEIEYYDSRVVKQDKSVPTKYYRVDYEVSNGVPTLKAVEV